MQIELEMREPRPSATCYGIATKDLRARVRVRNQASAQLFDPFTQINDAVYPSQHQARPPETLGNMASSKSVTDSSNFSRLPADDLPSYDSITGTSPIPPPHASGSCPPGPSLPAQELYLFSGPPNAEDLSTPISHEIEHIQTKQRIERIEPDKDVILSKIVGTDTCDEALSDPLILLDFLKHTAVRIPKIRLRCSGSRSEVAMYDDAVYVRGHLENRKEGNAYTVSDFEFFIDMTDLVSPHGISLSLLPSSTPAYRGKTSAAYGSSYEPARNSLDGYKQLSPTGGRHNLAKSGLGISWKAHHYLATWDKRRWIRGFPAWAKISDVPGDVMGTGDAERDGGEIEEPSMMDWCEAYCADKGWLKRFILRRDVWGWHFDGLVKATEAAIRSTGYNHTLKVRVEWDEPEVVIRPSNRWNRANSNIFINLLLCITLIYPMIWLLNYTGLLFGSGGKYDLARASYNLKPYVPLPDTFPGETLQAAQERLPSTLKSNPHLPANLILRLGPQGVHYLAGRKEGEWFALWEDRIKVATQSGYKGEIFGRAEPLARDLSLDGYQRAWSAAE